MFFCWSNSMGKRSVIYSCWINSMRRRSKWSKPWRTRQVSTRTNLLHRFVLIQSKIIAFVISNHQGHALKFDDSSDLVLLYKGQLRIKGGTLKSFKLKSTHGWSLLLLFITDALVSSKVKDISSGRRDKTGKTTTLPFSSSGHISSVLFFSSSCLLSFLCWSVKGEKVHFCMSTTWCTSIISMWYFSSCISNTVQYRKNQ